MLRTQQVLHVYVISTGLKCHLEIESQRPRDHIWGVRMQSPRSRAQSLAPGPCFGYHLWLLPHPSFSIRPPSYWSQLLHCFLVYKHFLVPTHCFVSVDHPPGLPVTAERDILDGWRKDRWWRNKQNSSPRPPLLTRLATSSNGRPRCLHLTIASACERSPVLRGPYPHPLCLAVFSIYLLSRECLICLIMTS